MNQHFYRGFIKQAELKKESILGIIARPAIALGQKIFGKGLTGKLTLGFTGLDTVQGAREGMRMADSGKGAIQAFERGRMTV